MLLSTPPREGSGPRCQQRGSTALAPLCFCLQGLKLTPHEASFTLSSSVGSALLLSPSYPGFQPQVLPALGLLCQTRAPQRLPQTSWGSHLGHRSSQKFDSFLPAAALVGQPSKALSDQPSGPTASSSPSSPVSL